MFSVLKRVYPFLQQEGNWSFTRSVCFIVDMYVCMDCVARMCNTHGSFRKMFCDMLREHGLHGFITRKTDYSVEVKDKCVQSQCTYKFNWITPRFEDITRSAGRSDDSVNIEPERTKVNSMFEFITNISQEDNHYCDELVPVEKTPTGGKFVICHYYCLLYTSPSPRDS